MIDKRKLIACVALAAILFICSAYVFKEDLLREYYSYKIVSGDASEQWIAAENLETNASEKAVSWYLERLQSSDFQEQIRAAHRLGRCC